LFGWSANKIGSNLIKGGNYSSFRRPFLAIWEANFNRVVHNQVLDPALFSIQ